MITFPLIATGATAAVTWLSGSVRVFFFEMFRWPGRRSAIIRVGDGGGREIVMKVAGGSAPLDEIFEAMRQQATENGLSAQQASRVADSVAVQLRSQGFGADPAPAPAAGSDGTS